MRYALLLFWAFGAAACTLEFPIPGGAIEPWPAFDPGPLTPGVLNFSAHESTVGSQALFVDHWGPADTGAIAQRVLLADLDSDGDADVIVAGLILGQLTHPLSRISVVFKNEIVESGSLTFTDVTGSAFDADPPDTSSGDSGALFYVPPSIIDFGNSIYRVTRPLGIAADPESSLYSNHLGELGAMADLDRDGRLDLIAGASDSAPRLFVQTSERQWVEHSTFPETLSTLTGAIFADVDGDSLLDAVVMPDGHLWLGQDVGVGRFGFAASNALASASLHSQTIAAGDFDADGQLDIAHAGTSAGGHRAPGVLINQGTTFAESQITTMVDDGADDGGMFLATADFDCDGYLDLALAGDNLYVLRNLAGQGFEALLVRSNTYYLHNLGVADLDLDGDVDILMCIGPSNAAAECILFENEVNRGPTDAIELFLAGHDPNPTAIGARVVAFPAGRGGDFSARPLVERQVIAESGMQFAGPMHLGLPPGDRFDIAIWWPGSSAPQILPSVPRGARGRVTQP